MADEAAPSGNLGDDAAQLRGGADHHRLHAGLRLGGALAVDAEGLRGRARQQRQALAQLDQKGCAGGLVERRNDEVEAGAPLGVDADRAEVVEPRGSGGGRIVEGQEGERRIDVGPQIVGGLDGAVGAVSLAGRHA